MELRTQARGPRPAADPHPPRPGLPLRRESRRGAARDDAWTRHPADLSSSSAALAVVLVGFSVALYALAAKHLHRQADERLEAALNTLAAAAEIEPDGVEWEPEERSLSFGRRTVEGQFVLAGPRRPGRADRRLGDGRDRPRPRPTRRRDGPRERLASFTDDSGVPWRVDEPSARSPASLEANALGPPARHPGQHVPSILAAGGVPGRGSSDPPQPGADARRPVARRSGRSPSSRPVALPAGPAAA